jgi:titin
VYIKRNTNRKLLALAALTLGISGFLVFRHVSEVKAATTITVNSTADTQANDGVCTLREAITAANTDTASGVAVGECAAGSGAGDTIEFSIAGAGPHNITPASALPVITTEMTINGYSEPDATANTNVAPAALNGTLAIVIDGTGAGAVTGLNVQATSTIRGLVIRNFGTHGITLGASNSTIAGNYIGTDVAGTGDQGNAEHGILILASASNTIGGTAAADRNLISGNNNNGIRMTLDSSDNNTITGNIIGLNATGAAALANTGAGISVLAGVDSTTIGGSVSGSTNVISGNGSDGIFVTDSTANSTQIMGNYIGTDVTGELDLGNVANGVRLDSSTSSNVVGGDTIGERNIISGNNINGVTINASSTGNTVSGNYIGTDDDGLQAIPNTSFGVYVEDSPSNTIGGSTAGTGNVISGNTSSGVVVDNETSDGNTLAGNYVGLTGPGTAALANGSNGIQIQDGADNTVIGGSTAETRNVISGNAAQGVQVLGAATTGTSITGNYIGTNAAGTAAVGNGDDGIATTSSAPAITVGGTTSGAGNVISGNTDDGVFISTTATSSVFLGNYVGTNAAGTAAVANGGDGIHAQAQVTVGGTASGSRNIISGNTANGLYLDSTADSSVVQGNYVGTNAAGTAAIPNVDGVRVGAGNNSVQIGGDTANARNVASGNSSRGLWIESDLNTIQGNYVGLSANGLVWVANCSNPNTAGIVVAGNNNVVGGNTAGERNVISPCGLVASTQTTLQLLGAFGAGNGGHTIQGNYIGTDINGNPVGTQGGVGIVIVADSNNNLIGGTGAGEGNLVRGNGAGIFAIGLDPFFGVNNSILGNSIYQNTGNTISGLGIDLFQSPDFGSSFISEGVTPNDVGDPDADENHYMNFPVLSAITSNNGTVDITYSLDINNAEAGATGYRVEFFANDAQDSTGHGEGQTYLGAETVSGDVTNRTVTLTLPAGVSGAKYLSATTTMTDASIDGFGHSSEFSANLLGTLVAATSGGGGGSSLANTGTTIGIITLVALASIGTGLYISRRRKVYTSGK